MVLARATMATKVLKKMELTVVASVQQLAPNPARWLYAIHPLRARNHHRRHRRSERLHHQGQPFDSPELAKMDSKELSKMESIVVASAHRHAQFHALQ
eukprot:SAG31_NODE_360_length_17025_cov_5.362460_13_plen_98_part_00